VLNRPDLIVPVVDGPYGFRQQIDEGVVADGTWWEASASYHCYTVAALLALAESLPASGAFDDHGWGSIRRHPKLRQMLLAPLRWAYPDLTLPALNDCWYHSSLVAECGHGMPRSAALYETAAGWFGDAAFHAVLAATYAGGAPRDTLEALLYGPDEVPRTVERPPALLTASANLDELGVAVLRTPAPGRASRPGRAGGERAQHPEHVEQPDRRTYLLLKYGPHGGGHGHPDKLGITLFAQGQRLSPDLGTPGYGIGLNQSWYRHTLSHNTVLLDGQSQPPATGHLRAFRPLRGRPGRAGRHGRTGGGGMAAEQEPAGFGILDAEVSWEPRTGTFTGTGTVAQARAGDEERHAEDDPYSGVRFRRVLLARPTYFLDLFVVACSEPRQIDWVYHNLGQLIGVTPAGAPAPAAPAALPVPALPELLRGQGAWSASEDLRATFATGDAGLDLWLAPVPGALVIAAGAPANPASETMALLLRRSVARTAFFAAAFHPYRGRPGLRAVSWERLPSGVRCHVETTRGLEDWEIDVPPALAATVGAPAERPTRPARRTFRYRWDPLPAGRPW
jgi:hypothetical protein